MEIDKELTDAGLTEELLLFFHSRTANNNKKIENPIHVLNNLFNNIKYYII